MKHLLPVVFFLSALAFSCKHQQHATSGNNYNGPADQSPPKREGGMTAGKANEEEIFVQGCIEKSIGNPRKALVEFQEVLTLNPNNAAANYELAAIYLDMGQADRALRYAKAAADLNPDNRWYQLRYAEILQDNGQNDEAIRILKTLSDKEPENTDLLFRYAAVLQKAGKADEALAVYDRIESLEGNSDTLANSRLAAYRSQKNIAGEEKTLSDIITAFPGESDHYLALADFYTRNNQPDKAADVYQKMLVQFPYLVTPRLQLAQIYESQKQHDKAFAQAEQAFEFPDAPEEKVALLKKWYPVSDSAPPLTAVQKKEADSLCRVLRRVNPDRAESYTLSGDYLYRDGKWKEARDQYKKAVAIDEDSYETWMRILEINDKLKDEAAQKKDCEEMMGLYPTQPDAYYYLGLIQYNQKNYKAAIPNLESAMDYTFKNPQKDLQIKMMLVDAYRANGDNDKADKYSEEVIEKDSSNLPLIAAYCASQADQGKNLFKCEQLMQKVVAKEPGNASYQETLAWIEYKMADYKEAKNVMDKALAKSPDNARMNERMGDIQFRLGNADEALKYWKKAKEKGGTNPALERKISSKAMLDNE